MIKIRKKPSKCGEIKYQLPKDETGVFKDFIDGIKNSNFNQDIFYHNIKNVSFEKVSQAEMNSKMAAAEYNCVTQVVRYVKSFFKVGIMHELFHVLSTIVGKNVIYTGFCQYDMKNKVSIGLGLNEGYTCLLDKRYFADYDSKKKECLGNSYAISTHLVSLLEDLVGKDNMEKWYSEADLYSLFEYLANIMGKKETMSFILALDNIFRYWENVRIPNPFVMIKNYNYAINFIGSAFLNVFTDYYKNEKISLDEYKEYLTYIKIMMQQQLKLGRLKIIKSRKITDREFDSLVRKTLKKYT